MAGVESVGVAPTKRPAGVVIRAVVFGTIVRFPMSSYMSGASETCSRCENVWRRLQDEVLVRIERSNGNPLVDGEVRCRCGSRKTRSN